MDPRTRVADHPELPTTIFSHLSKHDCTTCARVSKGFLPIVAKFVYAEVEGKVFDHLYDVRTPPRRLETYLASVVILRSPNITQSLVAVSKQRYPSLRTMGVQTRPPSGDQPTPFLIYSYDMRGPKPLVKSGSLYTPSHVALKLSHTHYGLAYREVTLSGSMWGTVNPSQKEREKQWRVVLIADIGSATPVLKDVASLVVNCAKASDPPLDLLLKATPRLNHLHIFFTNLDLLLLLLNANPPITTLLPDLRSIELILPTSDSSTGQASIDTLFRHPTLHHITLPFHIFVSACFSQTSTTTWLNLPQPGPPKPRFPSIRTIEFHLYPHHPPPIDLTSLRVALLFTRLFSTNTQIRFLNRDNTSSASAQPIDNFDPLYRWVAHVLVTREQLMERGRGEVGWKMERKEREGLVVKME